MNHLNYVPYSEDDIDYVNTEMKSSYEPPNFRDLQKYQQVIILIFIINIIIIIILFF